MGARLPARASVQPMNGNSFLWCTGRCLLVGMPPRRSRTRRQAASPPRRKTSVVPAAMRRELEKLMHQQCWCWGCDIRRESGNLLLAFGASRVRPEAPGQLRSSAYHVPLADNGWAVLWGFGVAMVPAKGGPLVLYRYHTMPHIVSQPDALRTVWCRDDLPPLERADTAPAWWAALNVFRWIASYERWVLAHAGATWRIQCARESKDSVVPGNALANAWLDLAERIETRILKATADDQSAAPIQAIAAAQPHANTT